jgi:hypothetical protein
MVPGAEVHTVGLAGKEHVVKNITTWIILLFALVMLGWAMNRGLIATPTPEQILYLVKMVLGWTAWTCLVALVYTGLEKLFPRILCAPPAEDSPPGNS